MIRLVKDKNGRYIKYKVYHNMVYLAEVDLSDDDTLTVKDVVEQEHCTGCTFRPDDAQCRAILNTFLSGVSCVTNDPGVRRFYIRYEQILDYELKNNVNILEETTSIPPVEASDKVTRSS